MKKISVSIVAVLTLLLCQANFAAIGMLFNVTASGAVLSISTTVPNHAYPDVGIMVDTPGYSLKNAGTECVPNVNGYCLFSINATQSKSITIAGSAGLLDVILCLDGKNQSSCQHYKNISFQPTKIAKTAYVTNASGVTPVSLCSLDQTTGLITSCQDAGGGSALSSAYPQGIVLNNAGTMAYISGENFTSYAFQCSINPANGIFSSCSPIAITSPSGYEPYYGMLTLNSANTLAYLADYNGGSGRILVCPIVSGSLSGTCVDAGGTNISAYSDEIALNKAGTIAYIAAYDAGITVCNVVNGTSFTSCTLKTGGAGGSPLSFSEPGGVALNNTESILYVTDYDNGAVYGCATTANNTSNFDSCFVASSSIPYAWGIALNEANTMAYIADYGLNTYMCPIQNDGTFSTCVVNNSFNASVDIALGL